MSKTEQQRRRNEQIKIIKELENIKNYFQEQIGDKQLKLIFDSKTNKWDQKHTEFYKQINEKYNLLFVFEEREGSIFGYYLSAKIDFTGKIIIVSLCAPEFINLISTVVDMINAI